MSEESFSQKIARLKAERKIDVPEQVPAPVVSIHDPDLVPEADEDTYERTETDLEIDRLIDGIDIIEAYAKFCGKMTPKVGSKTESIMISCPRPDHRDKIPSAWINTDKQTYFCAKCDEGGDKYTLAAIHFGMDDDYQHGKNFVELRKRIAENEGYVVRRTPGGQTYMERPEQDETDSLTEDQLQDPAVSDMPDMSGDSLDEGTEPVADPVVEEAEPLPSGTEDFSGRVALLASKKAEARKRVIEVAGRAPGAPMANPPSPAEVRKLSVVPEPGDDDEAIEFPSVDWKSCLNDSTFLRRWMEIMSNDDLPEEFYFWLGLQAIGFAAGRETTLGDNPPVNGNLFVCLYGPSGQGKSRATRALVNLLADALPYDHEDDHSSGTYMIPTPGSAEALVDAFSKPIYDPVDPKKIYRYGQVRGLVRFDELATLTGRGNRAGSVMKPTLMEFFDCYSRIELKSRGAGHVIAQDPFASIITTTQPRAIKDLLVQTDADSGFINRWIFAGGTDKKRVSFGRTNLDHTPCVDLLRNLRAWSATHKEITLSPEALAVWDSFFHDTLIPAVKREDNSLLTRCDLHLKKIMMLFAIDRKESEISIGTMMDVISLWTYLERSYNGLAGQIGVGPLEEARAICAEVMIAYEKKNDKGMTLRELGKAMRGRKVPIELMDRLIQMMIRLNEVDEIVLKPERGPATVRYRYKGA